MGGFNWTREDFQIIEDYYHEEGSFGCHIRLPHRTKNAIINQAQKLGVKGKGFWLNYENQILKDYYSKEGSFGCRKRLLHKTINGIQKQASKLGIKRKFKSNGLTGNIYGIYEVTKRGEDYISLKGNHSPRWWIRCTKCGAEKLVRTNSLLKRKFTSCSNCPKLEIGKMYGYLEPIERIEDGINKKSKQHYQRFRVKCHYGAEGCRGAFPVRADSVLSGHTKSCGCLHRENHTKPEGTHLTKLSLRYYKSPEFCKLKNKALERDNYTCVISGIRGGDLNEHHIIPRNYYFKKYNITTWKDVLNCKELWDIDNLITISEEWHKGIKTDNPLALHRLYHGSIYTKENYYKWLEELDLNVF